MFSFLGVPVDAAYHLVSGLTGVLTPVLGGLAAVAAIIAFTMAVRLLLMPLSLRALRGQAVQARLAPQLQALRQRYGKQPERLQREMSALYKREGTSVFAGFAPLLLQWPFLSVMYLLFRSPTVGGTANTLLTRDLLGVPLGTHWLSGAGPASAAGRGLPRRVRAAGRPVLAVRPAGTADERPGHRRAGGRSPASRGNRRLRAAGQGAAVPDRGHRRVRAARGRDLPAHVAGLVPGRADVLLAIMRAPPPRSQTEPCTPRTASTPWSRQARPLSAPASGPTRPAS